MKDIILFGIQGSGKGTQASKILEKFDNFAYLSTGDIFRALIKWWKNPVWDYITDKIEKWILIPDDLTISIFKLFYHTIEDKTMLLDWYPRSITQIDNLISFEKKQNRQMLGINFTLPEEIAIERMLSRWRWDDNEESIKKRLEEYYTKTEPTIKYFAENCQLINIDANRSIEEIFADVVKIIEKN